MLQIKHLTFTHRQDLRVLLSDFSLVLNPGDRAVIIGEEGNARMAGRLRKARRILGLPAFREELATFDSELRAGEVPANKGATLNARLSAREALG